MDNDSEAARLFNSYNQYRLQTANQQQRRDQGQWVARYKLTTERLQLFEDVIDWCRKKNIDPKLWVFFLFRSRRWTYPPPIKPIQKARAHLMSEKSVQKYFDFLDSNRLDAYVDPYRNEQHDQNNYDPNVDILDSVEHLKNKYVSQHRADRCMRDMISETFGFHPKSTVCQNCPLKDPCRQKLQEFVDFDIMGLRMGQITSDQAKIQVRTKQGKVQPRRTPTGIKTTTWE